MPTARTEHEIKIKADARAVKSAGDEIKKALSPASAREMKSAVKDLERDLKGLAAQQVRLNRELSRVEKGTESYKKLREELKGVQEQAKGVHGVMEQIGRAYRGVGPGAQRGSFVAGLGQGLGVAQYLPTGPGMGMRMGGAMLGQGVRRAAGAAAAPFLMPGVGGMAQALQAIPLAGTAMAGALQTAGGYFQQAVGFHQARQANLFMGGMQDFRQQARNIRGFAGGVQVTGPASKALKAAQADARQAQLDLDEANSAENWTKRFNQANRQVRDKMLEQAKADERAGATRGGRMTSGRAAVGRMRHANLIAKLQGLSGGRGRAGSVILSQAANEITRTRDRPYGVGTPESAEAVAKRMVAADKVAAEARGVAAREKIEDLREAAAAESRKAKWAAYRKSVGDVGRMSVSVGTEFGFQPTQVQGMLGQFGRMRGGALDANMKDEFREAMAAQVVAGTSMQQAGSFARMMRPGGGGTGEGRTLSETLGAAINQKLEGGQLGEYLDSLVQLGRQAEQQGVKIDPREFQRATGLLGAGGLGLKGLQAQRVATGMSSAAMQLSQTGAKGPQDMLLLRAAGYDPAKGPLSYVRAVNRLEGGLAGEGGSQIMQSLLGMMVQGTGGSGAFAEPEMQAFHLRRLMGRMGVGISAGQASTIIRGYDQKTGQLDPKVMAQLQTLNTTTEASGARRDLISAARGRARVGAGLAVTGAQLSAQQISEGAGMSKLMIELQKASIGTVKVLSNFKGGLTGAAKAVNEFVTAVDDFTKGSIVDKIKAAVGLGGPTKGGSGGSKGGGSGK